MLEIDKKNFKIKIAVLVWKFTFVKVDDTTANEITFLTVLQFYSDDFI